MRRLKALALLPALLVLLACAPSLIPVSVPDGIVDLKSRSLTLTKENVTITVFADAWRYDPIEVREAYTPLLIAITNNTKKDIVIGENSIFMYDVANVQYGVVSADAVDRSTMSAYPPAVIWGGGWGWGWGGGWGGGFWGWDDWDPWYGYYPYNQYGSDVVPLAFRFGPIKSGARVHGFVYLQNLNASSGQVRVVITPALVTGQTITFEFPFMIEQ